MDETRRLPFELTNRQREIWRFLRDQSPELEAMYLGALHAYADEKNPDHLSQAAHSIRELHNALTVKFEGVVPQRLEATNELDRVLRIWDDSIAPMQGPQGTGEGAHEPNSVRVPVKLYSELRGFFEKFRASRRVHRRRTGRLFEAFEPPARLIKTGSYAPMVSQWIAIHEWFTRAAHHGPFRQEEFSSWFLLFEDALYALVAPFYGPIKDLEPLLLIASPSDEEVYRAVALLKKEEHVRYFFSHLHSPGWLRPLRKHGYFSEPPPPEPTNGGLRFPPWPEGDYLRRIAKDAPDEVVDIILSLPDTENMSVQNDLLEAMLVLPSSSAAQLVGPVKVWIKRPFPLPFPQPFGKLMSKLAHEGQVDKSLELADTLLEPTLKERPSANELFPGLTSPEVKGFLDDWYYSEILREFYPRVLEVAPERALKLLCYKLRRLIQLEQGGRGREDTDSSFIWRPAIERFDQTARSEDMRNSLVTSIRDAGEQFLKEAGEDADRFLDFLVSLKLSIFRRLELHFLRGMRGISERRISERLGSRELFDDLRVRHEYTLLITERFGSLAMDTQRNILGWIEHGPDTIAYSEQARRATGKEASEDQVRAWTDRWRLQRLSPIKDSLPTEWKDRYAELHRTYGEPEPAEFAIQSFSGPTSPLTAEEMRAMDPEVLVKFLVDWKPPGDFFGPSLEGLGRSLMSVVMENPDKYASLCDRLPTGMQPTYIRAFLGGFNDACKEGKQFHWKQILDLSNRILERPREEGFALDVEDGDTNWIPTRRTLAALISQGLQQQENAIPYEFRGAVWSILTTLLEDPDPTPAYETAFGGENMDPVTMAANSVRGETMHGVFRYMIWCARNHEWEAEAKGGDEKISRVVVPEVQAILEKELNPETEPSAAVRSVFGMYLPSLFYLDRNWVERHLHLLFPGDVAPERLRIAVWEAYLEYCRPYGDLALVVQGEYLWGVHRLTGDVSKRTARESGRRLGEHVMTLFWQGIFSLSEGSPVSEFFDKAPDFLRAQAVSFTGRSLQQSKAHEVQKGIQDRLQAFWDSRLEKSTSANREELQAFGYWISSPLFEPEWMLKRARKTLELTGGAIEDGDEVLRRLIVAANDQPVEVMEVVQKMLQAEGSWSDIDGWRPELHMLFQAVAKQGNKDAIVKVGQAVNHLGSLGFHEFRDLLES